METADLKMTQSLHVRLVTVHGSFEVNKQCNTFMLIASMIGKLIDPVFVCLKEPKRRSIPGIKQ